MSGRSIEAVLRLNTVDFDKDIERTQTALTKFRNSMTNLGKNSSQVSQGIQTITQALSSLLPLLKNFTSLVGQTKAFTQFTKGILQMSQAVQNLSNVTKTSQVGMLRIKEIMNAWSQAVRGLTVNIKGETAVEQKEVSTLAQLRNAYNSAYASKERLITPTRQYAQALEIALPPTRQMITNNIELARAENQVASSSTKASASVRSASASMNQGSASANRMATSTKGLGRAMSSLRNMGMLVGSMIAYNFIHNLGVATTETINAKSEMEGYFKMLHFGTDQVDNFNRALDETVKKFPRLNKYALGETISSIGVEFELTTQEMEKAMPVVSMITSEYLRAGRNVNEASLAVKDILQGEFQRLSRETGVKGDQLKEAGWSGDKNDVMGLLEALEKVGKSRNWDTFVLKANSLNDAVLILQNRFSEWSADMVNAVQPTILTVFNNLLSVAEGFAQGMGSVWDFLNSGTWESTAVNIGLLGGALGTVSQALVMYRSGLGLVEASQLGVKRSIASLVLGLKSEQLANVGVINSIKAKILGLKASSVAENGVTNAVRKKILAVKQESVSQKIANVQEQLSIAVKEESALATELETLQQDLNTASKEGLISATEAETIQNRINTLSKELNTGASLKQSIANEGLTATLYMLGTGEAIATAGSDALAISWGVLNGIFALSPIGWITGAILALAGAFYVLTGGLDPAFEKMKQFNEIMKNPQDTINPYREKLQETIDEYGEFSPQAENARKSLDNVNQSVQHGAYWNNEYNKSFEGIDASLDEISRKKLGDLGYTDEQIDAVSELHQVMYDGADKDYKALQVLHKQQQDYGKGLEDLSGKIDQAKLSEEDRNSVLEKYTGNMANLQKHSAIANTSDDWWEKSWNQLYAGMDQFWIDWDNFWLDTTKQFNNFDILGLLFGENSQTKDELIGFGKWLEDGWKYINDGLASWQKGAVEFLKPLDEFGDEVNKFLNDPLGYLGVQQHLDNVWKEMIEPLIKGITEDLPKYISDSLGHWGEVFDGIKKPFEDAWNNFWSFDWLPKFDFDIWSIFGFGAVSASDGSSDHPDVGTEMYQVIVQPIVDWWNGFMADPLSYIGNLAQSSGIGGLISALLGSNGMDFTWAFEFVNNNIITPISNTLQNFMADPVAFIGNMGFTMSGLLDGLFGTDIFTNVMTWVNNSIIVPFGTAIYNGIMQIPILSDILILLGFTDEAHGTSEQKGRALANAFGTMLSQTIGNIPILGDLLRLLGVIDSQQPNARGKGQSFGGAIYDGLKAGIGNMVSWATQEFQDIANGIRDKVGEAYSSAQEFGSNLWNGLNSVMKRASPGFMHDQVLAEFGTDIPNAITSSGDVAYTTAQYYGQQIRDGVASATQTNLGLDTMVGDYQTDAQNIAMSSEMMGTTTTTAFNDMTMSVNASTSQMQTNVTGTYSQIQSKQASSLNSMKTQNISAYNDMYLKSNQSLLQMRDSTSNVTHQMTNAWSHMKDQIVASANRLKNDSTVHFNQLSQTIGTFYGKIQNPSRWGAGHGGSTNVRTARSSSGRNIARAFTKHGAGGSSVGKAKYSGTSTMTVAQAKKMICPNGNCANLFDGYSMTDRIDINDFLANVGGEHGFGWGDWNGSHYQHIRTTSNQWGMKSPSINLVGGIPTNANFKVGEFENGTPKVSFSTFQSIAEAIFSRIPYKHYLDSSWKGSWLGALQAGACNCSDGADALIALASVFGFGGSKVWGKWGNEGHFWAVINGKVMDTTAWQGGYGWTSPKVHGYGSPTVRTAHPSGSNDSQTRTVNITVDMSNSTIYGVDDLDSRIENGVKRGLQEEFNDPFTVAI